MKKLKLVVFTSMLLCVLLIVACSTETEETLHIPNNLESVTITAMESFTEEKQQSAVVIVDSTDISMLQEAFQSAVKLDGIVDMADPHYKIEMVDQSYFLWINETSGSMMHTEDTHHLYQLSDEAAIQVYEIISSISY